MSKRETDDRRRDLLKKYTDKIKKHNSCPPFFFNFSERETGKKMEAI